MAIEAYPKYGEAYLMMAVAFLKLNRRGDAMKTLDQALEADSNFGKAYALRGRLRMEDKHYDKAEADFAASAQLDPNSWYSHFELARCLYYTGKQKEAIEEALRARDLPEASPNTHLLLADLYARENRTREAIEEMGAFLKADPNNPMAAKVKLKIAELQNQK